MAQSTDPPIKTASLFLFGERELETDFNLTGLVQNPKTPRSSGANGARLDHVVPLMEAVALLYDHENDAVFYRSVQTRNVKICQHSIYSIIEQKYV